jgi:hypothetical protein
MDMYIAEDIGHDREWGTCIIFQAIGRAEEMDGPGCGDIGDKRMKCITRLILRNVFEKK